MLPICRARSAGNVFPGNLWGVGEETQGYLAETQETAPEQYSPRAGAANGLTGGSSPRTALECLWAPTNLILGNPGKCS